MTDDGWLDSPPADDPPDQAGAPTPHDPGPERGAVGDDHSGRRAVFAMAVIGLVAVLAVVLAAVALVVLARA